MRFSASLSILLAAALTPPISAHPLRHIHDHGHAYHTHHVARSTPAIAPGTATCQALERGTNWYHDSKGNPDEDLKMQYFLTIGEPWAKGEGCAYTHDVLVKAVGSVQDSTFRDYRCWSAQGGAAKGLSFTTKPGKDGVVNQVLGRLYGGVRGGFGCREPSSPCKKV